MKRAHTRTITIRKRDKWETVTQWTPTYRTVIEHRSLQAATDFAAQSADDHNAALLESQGMRILVEGERDGRTVVESACYFCETSESLTDRCSECAEITTTCCHCQEPLLPGDGLDEPVPVWRTWAHAGCHADYQKDKEREDSWDI